MFCGTAIPYIYRFVCKSHGITPCENMKRGEIIFQKALKEGDEASVESLELFLTLFGLTLSHLSAALIPENGIILCGIIVLGIKDYLIKDCAKKENSTFLKAFRSNQSIAGFINTIPIYYSDKEDLGTVGGLVTFYFLSIAIL